MTVMQRVAFVRDSQLSGCVPSSIRGTHTDMKKSITTTKLKLTTETVRLLEESCLQLVVGGGPVKTRDLPCPIQTAKVDCG
jgi:hypothetical protein